MNEKKIIFNVSLIFWCWALEKIKKSYWSTLTIWSIYQMFFRPWWSKDFNSASIHLNKATDPFLLPRIKCARSPRTGRTNRAKKMRAVQNRERTRNRERKRQRILQKLKAKKKARRRWTEAPFVPSRKAINSYSYSYKRSAEKSQNNARHAQRRKMKIPAKWKWTNSRISLVTFFISFSWCSFFSPPFFIFFS